MRTPQLAYPLLFISNMYLHRKVFIQDAIIATISESLPKTAKNFVSETTEGEVDQYFQQDATNEELCNNKDRKIKAEKEKDFEQDEQYEEKKEESGVKSHDAAAERSLSDQRSAREHSEQKVTSNMKSTERKRNTELGFFPEGSSADESSFLHASTSGDNEHSDTTNAPISSLPSQYPVASVRPSSEFPSESPDTPTVSLSPSSSTRFVASPSNIDSSTVTDKALIETEDLSTRRNSPPRNIRNNNFILQSLEQIVASIVDSLFGDLPSENPMTEILPDTDELELPNVETVTEILPDTDELDLPNVETVTEILPDTDELDLPNVETVTGVLPDTEDLDLPDIDNNNNPIVEGLQQIITFIMDALFNNDEDESEPSASPSYQSVTSAYIDSSTDSSGSDNFIDDFFLDDDSSKGQDSSVSSDDFSSLPVTFNETEIQYLMRQDEELERQVMEYLAQNGPVADASLGTLSDTGVTKTGLVGGTCDCIDGSKPFNDEHEPWLHGKIAQIELNHYASVIRYIGVTYADGTPFSHGKKYSLGNNHTITLGENQHIVRVRGYASSVFIRQITFEKDDGKIYGPFGGNYDDGTVGGIASSFSFDFSKDEEVLLYLFGRANSTYSLFALGFASVPLSSTPGPTTVPTSQPTISDKPSISIRPSISPSVSSQPSDPTRIIRTDTVGGTEGDPFDHTNAPWQNEKIAQIELNWDSNLPHIRYIGIKYEKGQLFEQGYKDGDQGKIITLGEEEYILAVSGWASESINQITFETDKGKIHGPYGDSEGTEFGFNFSGDVLVYIFGKSSWWINQLGFAHRPLTSSNRVVRTGTIGSTELGVSFDDAHQLWEYGRITEIELYEFSSSFIIFIGITYKTGKKYEHGGKFGTKKTITLADDQYITKVTASTDDNYIRGIKFETNDDEEIGPYGKIEGFSLTKEFDFGGDALFYVFGQANTLYLYGLGFAYADSGTSAPTLSIAPSSMPSIFTIAEPYAQVDFSEEGSCPSTTCSLHNGAQVLTAPGGTQALRIDSDGPYANISDIDISPSSMPDCTLTIGLFLESIETNMYGYVLNNAKENWDRGIVLHDSRHYIPGTNMITSTLGQEPWRSWKDDNLDTGTAPTKQWFHVTAVFRQDGDCFVYVNGVKSDHKATGSNNDGLTDLIVGRALLDQPKYWADAWIKEVKVFNKTLTDAQIKNESDAFLATVVYEAEDSSIDFDGSEVKDDGNGYTGSGFVSMGGQGSWIEWTGIDAGGEGPCALKFRYALATSALDPRPCKILLNDVEVRTVDFPVVGESWSDYSVDSINAKCPEGPFKVRITATDSNGGPNVDHLQVFQVEATSMPSSMPSNVPSLCSHCNIQKFQNDSFTYTHNGDRYEIPKMGTTGDTWIHNDTNNEEIGTFQSFNGDNKAIYTNGSPKNCQSNRRGTIEIEETNDLAQDGRKIFSFHNCVYKLVIKCYCPSSAPSSMPSTFIADPLVKVDFSEEGSCPSNNCSLHGGAKIKTAPGGRQALRIDRDGKYASIPDIDISPSSMPDCTLTIGLYLESIPEGALGWVFGHSKYGEEDRSIILHDPQFSENKKNGVIASSTGGYWEPWSLNSGIPPTKQWFHVAAVFREGGECAVYVNGVRSNYTTIGTNQEAYPNLYIGRPRSSDYHWADAWIKEVKVFDGPLTDAQVQFESDNFIVSSSMPSLLPSLSPSSRPSEIPSAQPSTKPSSNPSESPSSMPSLIPSLNPSSQPSEVPSMHPSKQPSSNPSESPSSMPSFIPSYIPSSYPSEVPSMQPSKQPSSNPSGSPSSIPSFIPSLSPSSRPSEIPSVQPSKQPSSNPSLSPSSMPSFIPSLSPSSYPSRIPSVQPSTKPSSNPSESPSSMPSLMPSLSPSSYPSEVPSMQPSKQPSSNPSLSPNSMPSLMPSLSPSSYPSRIPSVYPTVFPSDKPSVIPSVYPTIFPSSYPSRIPSAHPSIFQSGKPSIVQSIIPSFFPSMLPSDQPSKSPSMYPSVFPSDQPSKSPSMYPSVFPSDQPSKSPSIYPSVFPSDHPSATPSKYPTIFPSVVPSKIPSVHPSVSPSNKPSIYLSAIPSFLPTPKPTVFVDFSHAPSDESQKIPDFEASCVLIKTEVSICEDDPTFSCSVFASQGYCNHIDYYESMNERCQKSCEKCPPPRSSDFSHEKMEHNSKDFVTGFDLDLTIKTDSNSQETSWIFLAESPKIIVVRSNESDATSQLYDDTLHKLKYSCGVSYTDKKQLNPNTTEPFCFTLEVHDSFGDGMCCDNGAGSFVMSVNNTRNETLEISNPFYDGSKLELSFCIDDGGKIESETDTSIVKVDQPTYFPVRRMQCKKRIECLCDSKPNLFTDVEKSDVLYDTKAQTLLGISMLSQPKELQDVESPQYKAACWALFDDPYQYVSKESNKETKRRMLQQYRVAPNLFVEEGAQKRMMQRYAMAVLYFSTSPHQWKKNFQFLSSRSECDWNKESNDNGFSYIQGTICDGDSNIISVYLGNNNLDGTIIEELIELKMLEILDLSNNNIQGFIPSVLGQLSTLRDLSLSHNKLEGEIPPHIFNATNLEKIELDRNKIAATIPVAIGNLRRLSLLNLNMNKISGSIPEALYSFKSLQFLNLGSNQLSSSISPLIGNLKKLKQLDISGNILNGQIPFRVGELSSLEELILGNNTLSGSIPSTVGELTTLSKLAVDENQLTGEIPESLFNLPLLRYLKLQDNAVKGSIPDQLCEIDGLDLQADCQNDVFEPQVSCSCCSVCLDKTPIWDGECADATIKIEVDRRSVDHDEFSYSSDGLEWSLMNAASEKKIPLRVRDDAGGGTACVAFTDCLSIDMLSQPIFDTYIHIYWNNAKVENNIRMFPGSLEPESTNEYKNTPFQFDEKKQQLNACRVKELLTCDNGYKKKKLIFDPKSAMRISFGKVTSLFGRQNILEPSSPQSKALCWVLQNEDSDEKLGLSDTEISERFVLTILHLKSQNGLFGDGEYPPESHECEWPGINCTKNNNTRVVTGISLSSEQNQIINGTLIEELGGLQYLEKMEFNQTQLIGTIPKSFSNLWSLKTLNLSGNRISGTLPSTLFYQLNNLQYIDLSYNKMSGRINGDIGSYSSIRSLDLSRNQFTGSFPLDGFKYYDLEYLDVSENELNSVEFDHLIKHTNLKSLDLSLNFFVGSLHEDAFTSLSELEYLNISQNDFSGTIPSTFPELSNITHFDIHSNRFKGVIPVGITDLSYIQYINLQGNKLTGSLPSQLNQLKDLETLILSHNEIKGTIPSDLNTLQNMTQLHLHGNYLVGVAPPFSNINSYITDCGFPSFSHKPISCPTCNTCCNSDGNCQEKSTKKLSQVELTIMFVCTIMGFLTICYLMKYYITHNKYLETFFCETVGLWNAMVLISDKSVYHFLLAKNKLLWFIAVACVVFQGATLFLFVQSADIANEASDREYTMTCPPNSLDCENSYKVSDYGFFVFGLILTIWLLKDIVGSVKLILVSFQHRNIDFFFAGTVVFTVTMLSLWSSIIYIIAIAVKNTDLIKDAVVLLFVIEIDERIYELVENINPDWVDHIEKDMRNSFIYEGNDLVISSVIVGVFTTMRRARKKMHRSYRKVVDVLMRKKRRRNRDSDNDIIVSTEAVDAAAPELRP